MKRSALSSVALVFALVISIAARASAAAPATQPAASSSAKAFTGGRYTIASYTSSDNSNREGKITIKKRGEVYAMDINLSGDDLEGVAVYQNGELWAAVGAVNTMSLSVYKIDNGNLAGTSYNMTGDPTKFGSENLSSDKTIAGDFNITTAKAPYTGAAYAGKVTLKPLAGKALGNAPVYHLDWNAGAYKAQGVGFKTADYLIAATSTGPEWAVIRFKIDPATGAMNGEFYSSSKAVGTVTLSKDGN